VFLWVTRPWLAAIRVGGVAPLGGLGDSMIAVAAAVALFLLPVDRRRGIRAMDWEHAIKLPWGVLILFGGGLTLAAAVDANGVAGFLASAASNLGGLPTLLVVLAVVTFSIFATEMTSNTALVSLLLPILAAVAPALGVPAQLLLIPCALAASFAFMMPVGTPPNAIVFGTGLVTIPQMCKAGIVLNIAGVLLVTVDGVLRRRAADRDAGAVARHRRRRRAARPRGPCPAAMRRTQRAPRRSSRGR
jgi:solute carrier family 13 (sodium-dependent dicarboxylate transporter), member 2/3/5